jgi:L-amino acid N-acyltransferase YncA
MNEGGHTMTATIRMATPDDAETIQALYEPYVRHTIISFETVAPTVDEIRHRIAKKIVTYPWLVYELDGVIVGYAYGDQHNDRLAYQWSVDVSVYVHEQRHRHGIGRALYTSLLALLRLQGFYNVYAGIALPNAKSVGVHEAMGMTLVGIYEQVGYKFGAWHDVGWWQMMLQPRILEPPPPLTIQQAQALTEWRTTLKIGERCIH